MLAGNGPEIKKEGKMAELGAAELASFQQGMTDQQKMVFTTQYASDKKDRTTALILSILIGFVGVDRFYIGDTSMGLLKLFTGGLCGVLALIDWFLIMGKADDYNRRKAQEIAASIKISSS